MKEYDVTPEYPDASALASIGDAYYRGIGMEVDYAQAFRYYQKAASMGFIPALCHMGYCYEKGLGIKQSYEEALNCYEDAAEEGDAEAMFRLGDFYWTGIKQLVPRDRQIASQFYYGALAVVELQHLYWYYPDVYLRIGKCLLTGVDGERDLKEALSFFENAAQGYYERIASGDSASEPLLEEAEKLYQKCLDTISKEN